jgi:hypothetical protein
MNESQRSIEISKLTFKILKSNKKLLIFSIVSILMSFSFFGFMVIFFILNYYGKEGIYFIDFFMFFLTYLGIYLIINFFNVCIIYSLKGLFENKEIKTNDAIKFSLSILKRIFYWTLVSATIGLLLRLINGIAKRLGNNGKIILTFIRSILGELWSILSVFILPIMVYNKSSPIVSVRKSSKLIRKTWGENLVKHYSLGLSQLYVLLIGISIISLLSFILFHLIGAIILPTLILISILFLISIIVLFKAANQIFNTILFLYADKNIIQKDFNKSKLKLVFIKEK